MPRQKWGTFPGTGDGIWKVLRQAVQLNPDCTDSTLALGSAHTSVVAVAKSECMFSSRTGRAAHTRVMVTDNAQSQWIKRMTGKWSVAVAFLWGFAEGTFFFVVPDVAIALVALLQPRRAWRHIVAAIAGSLIGGALLFNWAVHDPQLAKLDIASVPFVTRHMFAQVQDSFVKHGIGAVFLGPLSGIPYKIFAVEAPAYISRTAFLWATIPARAERFVAVWLFFGALGALLRSTGRWKPSQLVLLHSCLWIVFYAFYWGRIVLL